MAYLLLKKPSVLPGFGLTLGLTLLYTSLIVLLPLACLFAEAAHLGWQPMVKAVTHARVLHAFELSFGISFIAAAIDGVFGLIIAWVLVRYQFPGRRIADAIVDLPFALPTAVAGIALSSLLAPQGWIGQFFTPLGIKIAFTPLGILVALMFTGLPFMVRTVQPVIEDIDGELEEAAAALGATRWQTFSRVLLPALLPALATGFALSFARGLGEYGSVIFIAGNLPMKSEIVPLLIAIKIEQFNVAEASAIAIIMLLASFLLLLLIQRLQRHLQRRRT